MTDNMDNSSANVRRERSERDHDAARDAEVSSGAPDAMASEIDGHGTADTVDGALTPGSTATSGPTSSD